MLEQTAKCTEMYLASLQHHIEWVKACKSDKLGKCTTCGRLVEVRVEGDWLRVTGSAFEGTCEPSARHYPPNE